MVFFAVSGKLDACSKWFIYTNRRQNPKANTVILGHVVIICRLAKNVVRGTDKMKEKSCDDEMAL